MVNVPPPDFRPLVEALTPRVVVSEVTRTQDGDLQRIVKRPLAAGEDAPVWSRPKV